MQGGRGVQESLLALLVKRMVNWQDCWCHICDAGVSRFRNLFEGSAISLESYSCYCGPAAAVALAIVSDRTYPMPRSLAPKIR